MTYVPWPKMMYRAEGDYRPFANAAEAAAAGPEWRTLDEIRGQVPPEPDAIRISPPDLDGDGKPGGCAAPADSADLSALRAAYKAKFGPVWRPKFIAAPTTTPLALALLDVALLTSGGWLGLLGLKR